MIIGYSGYVIVIFFLTGVLILLTDVKAYKNANLLKEQKASTFFGWASLTLGFTLLLANFLYRFFIW